MNDEHEFSILIVDDEKSNLNVLNNILEDDHTIYVAKSGEAGLRKALEVRPDIILLDILMPDMSGFDVLLELKESDITRGIPVIFITGLDNVEDEETGFFLGAVDYITKPFHPSIVKARVNTHLQIVKHIRTIEQLGLIDVLTGVPNRRGVDARLAREWGRAAREKLPLSLMMIDVDNFRAYNESYGHPQGDALLKVLARIFGAQLKRPADTLARWAGKTFVALLPNTPLPGAQYIAECIRGEAAAAVIPTVCGDYPTQATVSIGLVQTVPRPGGNMDDFINEVDRQLRLAKQAGRNLVLSRSLDTA